MSSIVEPDKENQGQQTVSRKVVTVESGAPRTPFAAVNRQRAAITADKQGQLTSKSKRRSWAPESLHQSQKQSTGDAFSRTKTAAFSCLTVKEDEEKHPETEDISSSPSGSAPVCLSLSLGDLPALSPPGDDPHSPRPPAFTWQGRALVSPHQQESGSYEAGLKEEETKSPSAEEKDSTFSDLSLECERAPGSIEPDAVESLGTSSKSDEATPVSPCEEHEAQSSETSVKCGEEGLVVCLQEEALQTHDLSSIYEETAESSERLDECEETTAIQSRVDELHSPHLCEETTLQSTQQNEAEMVEKFEETSSVSPQQDTPVSQNLSVNIEETTSLTPQQNETQSLSLPADCEENPVLDSFRQNESQTPDSSLKCEESVILSHQQNELQSPELSGKREGESTTAQTPKLNESQTLDLSMRCEEGTPPTYGNVSCCSQSDLANDSYNYGNDSIFWVVPASDWSNSSLASNESLTSHSDSPTKNVIVTETNGTAEISSLVAVPYTTRDSETDGESVQVARCILADIITAALEQTAPTQSKNEASKDAQAISAFPPAPTFLSEYAHFAASYTYESPACDGRSNCLTDVTPLGQESGAESSVSGCTFNCDGHPHMVDSASSVLSDSDTSSVSSASTIQRHLTFQELGSPESVPRSSAPLRSPPEEVLNSRESWSSFARRSQSRLDLREEEEDAAMTPKLRRDSFWAEESFLDLSLTEQRVEYVPLPPKLKSAACSPIDLNHHNQSQLPESHNRSNSSSTPASILDPVETSPVVADLHEQGVALLPTPKLGGGVKKTAAMMRSAPESVEPRPREITSVGIQTTPVPIPVSHSIALSPLPADICEREVNTSPTLTEHVHTMTSPLPVTDVALSPIVASRKEADTMTAVASTTEVGMETERVECVDHSVLVWAETENKTTMTDGSTGCRSVCTTMTPFKVLAKEGQRLTANDIRKQHPRALANQLETLTVANSRLEGQARSAQEEHKRVLGALKEARRQAANQKAELDDGHRVREREWKEKETKLTDQCRHLEEQCQQQQSRAAGLEQELCTLKTESEAATQQYSAELKDLQEKYQTLENAHTAAVEKHQLEIEELKRSYESDNYRHQFERALQMVREREGEVEELRCLFDDLQTTASQQEKVHQAHKHVHHKIVSLAAENRSLRESVAHKTEEEERLSKENQQHHNAHLQDEIHAAQKTMAILNANLAQLEELHSQSSTDLMMASGRLVELNSELFEAGRALQEAVMTRGSLESEVSSLRHTEASLREALHEASHHIQCIVDDHEALKTANRKMKKTYEDKLENMALGVENLQRTLSNREVDLTHLESDLYETRSTVVEQRQQMAALQTDLSEALKRVEDYEAEREDIEFYKKSNAFLEAERSVYVQSIRDLEEKLQGASLEVTQHRQDSAEAEQLIEELQEDKLRLISEVSDWQTQYMTTSKALAQMTEDQEKRTGDLRAALNDLMQHMTFMLTALKKKIGLQEMPEACPTEQPEPQPSTPPPPPPSSKPVRSRRHSRKSFVSSILGAAKDPGGTTSDEEWWESGSYLGEAMTASVRKTLEAKRARMMESKENVGGSTGMDNQSFGGSDGMWSVVRRDVKEVRVRFGDSKGQSLSESKAVSAASGSSSVHSAVSTGRRKLDFHTSERQPLSVSWTENTTSSSSSSSHPQPPYSLLHPSYSEPHSSNSKVHASSSSIHRTGNQCGSSGAENDGGEGLMERVLSLKEIFTSISRLAGIVDRATQLSLNDLKEENTNLRRKTEILEGRVAWSKAQLKVVQEDSAHKDSALLKAQHQCQELRQQMIDCTDHKFQIRRLKEEAKRLQSRLNQERSEKEVVSAELDSYLNRLETSTHSASTTSPHHLSNSSAQARCLRDLVALKKKNGQLMLELEEQRGHYEDIGSKAARRMRVLDENWKKAEDELYRLDDLVEHIRQIAEQSSSLHPDLGNILRMIRGDGNKSLHKGTPRH